MTKAAPALTAALFIALVVGSVALFTDMGGGEGAGARPGLRDLATAAADIGSLSTVAPETYGSWQARLAEEAAETQRIADEEAAKEEAQVPKIAQNSQTAPTVVEYPPECYGKIVSPAVLWRESRCDPSAVNVNGCGGRSCVSEYQLDLGHFAAVSPWNPNVPGVCYGLSPVTQAAECAARLPSSAWNG